jgi:HSP20 family protein
MITEVGVAVGRAVAERAGRLWSQFHEASPLGADVFEGDDAYLVVFDVPGAAHSDVQVRYVDGEVLVRLDRFRGVHEGFEMVFPGRGMALDGRAALPEDARVDPEAASATLTPRGTLEVTVPKGENDEDGETAHAEA